MVRRSLCRSLLHRLTNRFADTTPSCLDPIGPWNLESTIQLPDCSEKLTFTTAHDRANITVSHILKIMLRVERGDDDFLDSKGKRKLWDVIIEVRSRERTILRRYSDDGSCVADADSYPLLPMRSDCSTRLHRREWKHDRRAVACRSTTMHFQSRDAYESIERST